MRRSRDAESHRRLLILRRARSIGRHETQRSKHTKQEENLEPIWIKSPDEAAFKSLVHHAQASAAIAIDTESDSLYHYWQKVCLVQIALDDGRVFLLDPKAGFAVEALRSILESVAPQKILHGADYDVSLLKATENISPRGLFDTMLAAKFLGRAEIGLQATLRDELNVDIKKDNQKDDWSARPLSPAQVAYAAADVVHLIALARRQTEQLQEKGRLHWHTEECRALEDLSPLPTKADPLEVFRDVKGVAALRGHALAIFRELIACRERISARVDVPPFRIAVNEALIGLAKGFGAEQGSTQDSVKGAVRRREFTGEFEEAWARGVATAEQDWPALVRGKRIDLPPLQQKRIASLKECRLKAGILLGLDSSFVLPQRLIDRIAEVAPKDRAALGAIPGVRQWRVEALGTEILRCVTSP